MTELTTDSLPGDNRILSLRAIKVGNDRIVTKVDLHDNHSRPNLALFITDAEGDEVSRSLIMGTIESSIKFTLHIRVVNPIEPLSVTCVTFHEEDHPLDSKTIPVS